MDIHKPHAPHSWGEFAREIGVIVIGVLIALAFEEVARWVHDRSAAAEARATIRDAVQTGIDVMAKRGATLPCADRRIAEIGTMLEANDGGPLDPAPRWVSQPASYKVAEQRWQAVSASGRMALLPQDEQAVIASIYQHFTEFNADVTAEQEAWAQLRGLQHWKGPLSDGARLAFGSALQRARLSVWAIRLHNTFADRSAAGLGLKPAPAPPIAELPHAICLPMTMSRAEALRLLNDPGSAFGQAE